MTRLAWPGGAERAHRLHLPCEEGGCAGSDLGYAFAPGVVWHPGGNLELGLSAPVRFEQQPSWGALFNVVYEFELGGGRG